MDTSFVKNSFDLDLPVTEDHLTSAYTPQKSNIVNGSVIRSCRKSAVDEKRGLIYGQ